MNFKQTIYQKISEEKQALTFAEWTEKLGISTRFEREQLKKAVDALEATGEIAVGKKGKISLPERMGLIAGTVDGNRKGFAFLRPKDAKETDIFLPPRALNGAMHRDEVLVRITDEERREGEVVKVVSRGMDIVAGTFTRTANFAFVVPSEKKFFRDVFIPHPPKKLKNGQRVVARITKYFANGKNPEGEIEEVLGGGRESDILAIIRSYHLIEEFPPEVAAAADKVPSVVSEKEMRGRTDFTGFPTITIDGEDARDLDDAVSCEEHADGSFTLRVHIADVTHYVRENTPLDREAYRRGTSAYFPDRVLPMLPRALSNGICSLNEAVPRLTLSVVMRISSAGDVLSHEIREGVIKTLHRMNYTEVTAILEGDGALGEKYADILPMLKSMEKLYEALAKRRTHRGSIDMDLPEFKILTNDAGEITDIVPYPRTVSHRMIEEFMIVTNEVVAEHMQKLELPFLYRVHEIPDAEKVEDFARYVAAFGLKLGGNLKEIHPSEYLKLLDAARETPYYNVINRVMLRTMMKARYSEENLGHFGISSKCYCHYTSPIRRYPDLFIHRMIKMQLHGAWTEEKRRLWRARAEEAAVHCSDTERNADLAERDVDDYLKAEYMKAHIGDEFDGIISSVKDFGFFVELPNTIEGLVRVESLKGRYEYNEKLMFLKGAETYRLGDPVRIRVIGADTEIRKIDFEIAEN